MSSIPCFSIVLPSYNRAGFLPRSIQSVLDQSEQDWELIIVDDGSTDSTEEVVKSYPDPRIHYVYQDNAERSAARNRGIEFSRGQWICFLDSDDELKTHHLAAFRKMIDRDACPRLLCTNMERDNGAQKTARQLITSTSENVLKEIWTKFLVPTQSCVHRTILENHRFDVRFRLWEDTHLFLRIAAEFPVEALDEITCIQHVHPESTIEQGLAKVDLKQMQQYLVAIHDLKRHPAVAQKLSTRDFQHYVDAKYRMYLYAARQNKQVGTALHIWWKAIFARPSFYLMSEFPKIFLNAFGIAIHG